MGRGEATTGEPVLATSLWGMLYADDAGVVWSSPEQLMKMVEIIVVVCAVFGLTVLEAKPGIMCLRTKEKPESTTIFSVEAAGQVNNQANEFVDSKLLTFRSSSSLTFIASTSLMIPMSW